jgi:hypothetical protein
MGTFNEMIVFLCPQHMPTRPSDMPLILRDIYIIYIYIDIDIYLVHQGPAFELFWLWATLILLWLARSQNKKKFKLLFPWVLVG